MPAEMTADFTCTNHECAEYLRGQKGFPLGVKATYKADDGELRHGTVTAMTCAGCGGRMEEQRASLSSEQKGGGS